jgi:hypothetical protein
MYVTLKDLDHFIYYEFFVLKIFLCCVYGCNVAWCYEVRKEVCCIVEYTNLYQSCVALLQ